MYASLLLLIGAKACTPSMLRSGPLPDEADMFPRSQRLLMGTNNFTGACCSHCCLQACLQPCHALVMGICAAAMDKPEDCYTIHTPPATFHSAQAPSQTAGTKPT